MTPTQRHILAHLFRDESDRCAGCPFLVEWAERLTWLDPEPEGRVTCALLEGAPGGLNQCGLWQAEINGKHGHEWGK